VCFCKGLTPSLQYSNSPCEPFRGQGKKLLVIRKTEYRRQEIEDGRVGILECWDGGMMGQEVIEGETGKGEKQRVMVDSTIICCSEGKCSRYAGF